MFRGVEQKLHGGGADAIRGPFAHKGDPIQHQADLLFIHEGEKKLAGNIYGGNKVAAQTFIPAGEEIFGQGEMGKQSGRQVKTTGMPLR